MTRRHTTVLQTAHWCAAEQRLGTAGLTEVPLRGTLAIDNADVFIKYCAITRNTLPRVNLHGCFLRSRTIARRLHFTKIVLKYCTIARNNVLAGYTTLILVKILCHCNSWVTLQIFFFLIFSTIARGLHHGKVFS